VGGVASITGVALIMVAVFSAFAALSLIDLASSARSRLGPWPVAGSGRCGVAQKPLGGSSCGTGGAGHGPITLGGESVI
jgi:hypothetical protein